MEKPAGAALFPELCRYFQHEFKADRGLLRRERKGGIIFAMFR